MALIVTGLPFHRKAGVMRIAPESDREAGVLLALGVHAPTRKNHGPSGFEP